MSIHSGREKNADNPQHRGERLTTISPAQIVMAPAAEISGHRQAARDSRSVGRRHLGTRDTRGGERSSRRVGSSGAEIALEEASSSSGGNEQ